MKSKISLGELVSQTPGATRVLRNYQIDFCCGGNQSLEQACKNQNLNLNKIMSELEAVETSPDSIDWTKQPLSELIDHIVNFYHERLRLELPELQMLAEKVERVHAGHGSVPKGLAAKLEEILFDMFEHMGKEEDILFPMIKRGQGANAGMPIKVMRTEHSIHGENLVILRKMTNNFNPPADACGTWIALYRGLDHLEMELMEHIHLENNILFVRALGITD